MSHDQPLPQTTPCSRLRLNQEPCPRPAVFVPRLRLWAGGTPKNKRLVEQSAEITLDLPLCRKCTRRISRSDLITQQGWEMICQQLEQQGKRRPSLDCLEISFVPISLDVEQS